MLRTSHIGRWLALGCGVTAALLACSGGAGTYDFVEVPGGNVHSSGGVSSSGGLPQPGPECAGTVVQDGPDAAKLEVPAGIVAAAGVRLEAIARVPRPRHLAALPNGDLLVGTMTKEVYLVPRADQAVVGEPVTFLSVDDAPLHGVAFDAAHCAVYVGAKHGVYRVPYRDGAHQGEAGAPIVKLRQIDDASHNTTSVAVRGDELYYGVGSSCDACVERDPSRAMIGRSALDGSEPGIYARRTRNPIAFTVNPNTGTLWAGNAGQDTLDPDHPFEWFDGVTNHPPGVDYGWPDCEENRTPTRSGVDCSQVVVPKVVLPAYSTLIGAAFFAPSMQQAGGWPADYAGAALVTAHGSWHTRADGTFSSPPRVALVKFQGDTPQRAVDWNDPQVQFTDLMSGFETDDKMDRIGRPTGVAITTKGVVYVADFSGLIYRLTPAK